MLLIVHILIPKLLFDYHFKKFEKTIIFKSTHTENSSKTFISLFFIDYKRLQKKLFARYILRTRTHKLLYMTIVINELIFSRMEIG